MNSHLYSFGCDLFCSRRWLLPPPFFPWSAILFDILLFRNISIARVAHIQLCALFNPISGKRFHPHRCRHLASVRLKPKWQKVNGINLRFAICAVCVTSIGTNFNPDHYKSKSDLNASANLKSFTYLHIQNWFDRSICSRGISHNRTTIIECVCLRLLCLFCDIFMFSGWTWEHAIFFKAWRFSSFALLLCFSVCTQNQSCSCIWQKSFNQIASILFEVFSFWPLDFIVWVNDQSQMKWKWKNQERVKANE